MDIIQINSIDNVAVALRQINANQKIIINKKHITVGNSIAPGHKIALNDIHIGNDIIKYGYPIGKATLHIKAGEHIHTHNMKTGLSEHVNYTYSPNKHISTATAAASSALAATQNSFLGYKRQNGKIGIRNEIWIIPTVGCLNSTGDIIAQKAQVLLRGSVQDSTQSSVQGIYNFRHPYGCSQLGEDHLNTKKILCGLARHPNTGGILVLGLGCENNSVDEMRTMLGDTDESRVKFLVCQEHEDEISAALEVIEELISVTQYDIREQIPISDLIIGLKCGGSDGLSGITANPLVGAFSDKLISQGGSAILTEVPEMFGAETILMNRCKNKSVFKKTVSLINEFKNYYTKHGHPIYENPSPGNKAGGITTLEEKALGCTQKAGTAAVIDVLAYGEALHEKGLNLLESPGNDLVASTALAASGAHLILFTTGLGTPFGAPVPTIKISSNTALYNKKPGWIDFDAGPLAFGADIDKMANNLFSFVLELANGNILTKTEQNEIRDIAIFKNGVTL